MIWLLLTVVTAFAWALVIQGRRAYVAAQRDGEHTLDDDDCASAEVMVANDDPVVRIVNDILGGVLERGASAVRIGVLEHDEQSKEFSAVYVRDDEILHRMSLPLEHENQITHRLRLIAGLEPYASSNQQEGLIRFQKIGEIMQEFRVGFPAAESGGEILLKVQESTESNNKNS